MAGLQAGDRSIQAAGNNAIDRGIQAGGLLGIQACAAGGSGEPENAEYFCHVIYPQKKSPPRDRSRAGSAA